MAEILLAILGIVLSIVLSGPAINLYNRLKEDMARRTWSGREYRKGVLQHRAHLAFDRWSCRFVVDDDGTCRQIYDVRVLNIGSKVVEKYRLPIFSDAKPLKLDAVGVWARSRGRSLHIEVDQWDEQRAEGRVDILFSKPLLPGHALRFSYGLTLPRVFAAGDEYYDWDVELPYYDMCGEIEFARSWLISHVHWDTTSERHLNAPEVAGDTIRWHVRFPEHPVRLHLVMNLQKNPRH